MKPLLSLPEIQISDNELQTLIQGFPTIRQEEEVFHIGFLENPSQINGNLEGAFLSVSLHPEEWMEIARLGGSPTWALGTDKGILFIDALKTYRKKKKPHISWALKCGLLFKEKWWKTPADETEEGETRYFLCKTRKEAFENYDPGISEQKPHQTDVFLPHPILQAFWTQRNFSEPRTQQPDPWVSEDTLISFLLELAIQRGLKNTPDGIWWEEILDPAGLSAPRGAISPTRILQNSGFYYLQLPE